MWSYDSSTNSPFRLKAALESPALAMYIVFPTIRATFAVHPTESATLLFSKGCRPFSIVILRRASSPSSLPKILSSYLKLSSRALGYSSRLNDSKPSSTPGSRLAQY